eukprot:29212_1
MTETSQVAQLQNVIQELRQDLGAQQKELSSKTKKLVEMENVVSSLQSELTQKNKAFDELKITHKMASDHRTDEMYLQLEEYKNQIHSKELEKQEILTNFNQLQLQYNALKQQYDASAYKQQQTESECNMRLNRLDTMYKQRIETLKRMNQSQIKQSQDQMEAIKQTQFISSNKETINIKNSLQELKESHERIEADLNTQIEDLKDQMTKREKEKDQLIQELNQLSVNYKEYAQSEIERLNEKLRHFEQGNVEVVLKIELSDPVLSKPPPKKPAPPKPLHMVTHSDDSLVEADINLLSPKRHTQPVISLRDVKSSPDTWKFDSPRAIRNMPPHRSMPMAKDDEDDGNVHSDIELSEEDEPDEDSKESKSDDENRLFPVRMLMQAKSAGHADEDDQKVNENAGYKLSVKRRTKGNRRRAQSKSATSILPDVRTQLATIPSSSGTRTPTLYIFRQPKPKNGSDNDESESTQTYNAKLAREYLKRRESLSKYTDSALNVLKNGVHSMWGSTRPSKGAQTPNPVSTNRWVTGGFPNTRRRQQHLKTRSGASDLSSASSFGDIFSDNLSLASFGSAYGSNTNGKASSVALSVTDSLSNKSLELQRKMLMQANTRLAEDLKNEKKHLMIVKEKAHRKYKQLHIQLQAEQRHWKLKEKQTAAKLEKNDQQSKEQQQVISELHRKFHALQSDYNMRLNSGDPNAFTSPQQTNTNNQFMMKIRALDTNNKQLITQCEKYRRELSSLKQTVLSCNDTMKLQQNQILILNTTVTELRKLNGFGGSSSEQLLQKQIRLLKSQRRMLVKELRDSKAQNDKLKNIIVSGHSSTKTYSKSKK